MFRRAAQRLTQVLSDELNSFTMRCEQSDAVSVGETPTGATGTVALRFAKNPGTRKQRLIAIDEGGRALNVVTA